MEFRFIGKLILHYEFARILPLLSDDQEPEDSKRETASGIVAVKDEKSQ
jgi:hypothetical protein